MKIVVERRDQGLEARLRLYRNLLEVDGQSAIGGIGRKKRICLLDKAGAERLIREKISDLRNPQTLSRVEVVDERKDIQVHVVGGDCAGDLALPIDLPNRAAVDERIGSVVRRVSHYLAIRSDNVQPLRKQKVDLVDVLLQRRVAGWIVLDVVGRAQAFTRIEGNVAGLYVGSAVSRPGQLEDARRLIQ